MHEIIKDGTTLVKSHTVSFWLIISTHVCVVYFQKEFLTQFINVHTDKKHIYFSKPVRAGLDLLYFYIIMLAAIKNTIQIFI